MTDIRRDIERKIKALEQSTIDAYNRACLEMVIRAKQTNTYQDQTGLLRSSIGYVLYKDGVEVGSYFTLEPPNPDGEKTSKGDEGTQVGYAYAKELAENENKKGIVAVMVAGADYARYVESKGFDVITGATFQFNDDLKQGFLDIEQSFK